MALGTSTPSNSGPLLFLTPRTKDKNKKEVPPHFTVGRKVGEKIVDDEQTVTSVSGDLIRLEIKQKEYNGEPYEEVILYLRDAKANETYRLPMRFGMAPREFFNRLATLTPTKNFSNLAIDYYLSKKGFEKFGLKQNGENVEWKHPLDTLPKALEIKHPQTGKLLQRDYSEVNAFFKKELEAIQAVFGGAKNETPAAPKSEPAPAQKGPDEDVPF